MSHWATGSWAIFRTPVWRLAVGK